MQNEFDKNGQNPTGIIEKNVSEIKDKKGVLNKNQNMSSPFGENTHHARSKIILDEIEEIKTDLKDSIKENDIREIFGYFDIGVFMYKDGTCGLSEYKQPTENITFEDLGIDEAKLIEDVVKISGNADFRHSSLKSFYKIKQIGGFADFRHSNFKPGIKLPKIGAKIIFYEHQTLLQGIMIKLYSLIRQIF